MIGQINSASFKGTITVYASNKPKNSTNIAKSTTINTNRILNIIDNKSKSETEIIAEAGYPFDGERHFYVSKSNAPFKDILAAYTAACQNEKVNIQVGHEKEYIG